jgi:hypothetical protein
VDTGEQAAWTVQLTESSEQSPQHPLPAGNPLTQHPPAGARTAPAAPTPLNPSGNQSR